jgi:hypothetical protein
LQIFQLDANIDIYLIVPSEKNGNSSNKLTVKAKFLHFYYIMKHILFLLNVSILIKYFQNSLGGFRQGL